MRDDDLGFAEIQKIFAQKEKGRTPEIETQNNIIEFPYQKVELKSEPEYEIMRAKNIKITNKGKQTAANGFLKLAIGVAIVGTIFFTGHKIVTEISQPQQENVGIVYMDESYVDQHNQNVINPAQCDLSNITIILRESTGNVSPVVATANQELDGLGVDTHVIDSDDDMISLINDIRSNDNDREIIVINVDGVSNKGNTQTVIMTNYSNTAKSADALALAIHNGNEDIYGISSDIRCGKKDLTNGRRTKTSVETILEEAGYKDIACLTVAANDVCLDNPNNLATSIAEGVIRVASLTEEERYKDYIRRVEFGDTISELAEDNGVTSSYIESANREVLDYYNGNLQYNTAMVISYLPSQITSEYNVNNKMVTTDPRDITTKTSQYTVVENDTVSSIAEKLGVGISELVIPSGDIDVIKIGDKISYEKTEGPILVTKTTEKVK